MYQHSFAEQIEDVDAAPVPQIIVVTGKPTDPNLNQTLGTLFVSSHKPSLDARLPSDFETKAFGPPRTSVI